MTRIALSLALSLTLAGSAHASGKQTKTAKADKSSKADKAQAPVVLDLSAPDAPTSEFPDVVKKGSL
jgi:hypothetical protein